MKRHWSWGCALCVLAWIGAEGKDTAGWKTYDDQLGHAVAALASTRDHVWAATPAGLFRIDPGSGAVSQMSNDSVCALGSNGRRIWAATIDGLLTSTATGDSVVNDAFSLASVVGSGDPAVLGSGGPTSILFDTAGAPWVAYASGMLIRKNLRTGAWFREDSGLGSQPVHSRFCVRDGTLLVVTGEAVYRSTGGVYQPLVSQLLTIKDNSPDSGKSYRPCDLEPRLQDKAGSVWFSAFYIDSINQIHQHVLRLTGNTWERVPGYDLHYNSDTTPIAGMVEDETGRIWVGSGADLQVYDGRAWSFVANPSPANSGFEVDRIIKDSRGALWVLDQRGGGGVLSGGGWTVAPNFDTAADSLLHPNRSPFAVTIDSSGRLWHTNRFWPSGVNWFVGEDLCKLAWWSPTAQGTASYSLPLAGTDITGLFTDSHGTAWITTKNKGVGRFENGAWRFYDTTNSGLKSNSIVPFQVGGLEGLRVVPQPAYTDSVGGIWVAYANSSEYSSSYACFKDGEWHEFGGATAPWGPTWATLVHVDASGSAWFRAGTGNLYELSSGAWTIIPLPVAGVKDDVVLERSGGIGFSATHDSTLEFYQYNGNGWDLPITISDEYMCVPQFLVPCPGGFMLPPLQDTQGALWFKTNHTHSTSGWERLHGSNSAYYDSVCVAGTCVRFAGHDYRELIQDRFGQVWFVALKSPDSVVVSWTTATGFDGRVFVTPLYGNSPFVYHASSVFVDSRGRRYFTCLYNRGSPAAFVGRYDGDAWVSTNFTGRPMLEDHNGNVWTMAIERGDGVSTDKFTPRNSGMIPGDFMDIAEDSSGTVWILTSGGLCSFDNRGASGAVRRPFSGRASTLARGRVSLDVASLPGGTTVRYQLPAAAHVRLSILDAKGRTVAVLADCDSPAGENRVVWRQRPSAGRSTARGVYIVDLRGPGFGANRRIQVVN